MIALLVLLPETLAAVRAARRNLVQTSLNLGYGSAMASIGLTVVPGRATRLQGSVHLAVFATFVFLSISP